MQVIQLPSPEAVSHRAADLVAATLAARPSAALGLPAGGTPAPLYAELVRRHQAGALSFARAHGFGLDEYLDLPPGHPRLFRRFLDEALFGQVDFAPERAQVPGLDPDDYERRIAAAGGLELCLLGIGGNGHIAFNEPGAPFDSRTRVVALAEDSRAAVRAAFAGEAVPRRAVTMGIGTILSARRCLLLAFGAAKAEVVARAVEGPVTPEFPASALQTHPDVTVVVDAAAASRLTPTGG